MKSSLVFVCIGWQIILFSNLAVGRQTPALNARFQLDTLKIKGGQTFANKLVLENLLDRAIEVEVGDNQTRSLQGLINIPKTITLAAKEKRVYPVKYVADRRTILRNMQAFTATFSSAGVMPTPISASFYVQLSDASGVNLMTDQSEYYLNQLTNQTQVLLRCSNSGLVAISFKLVLSEVPEGLDFTGDMMSFTLQPGAEQLIPFTARNRLNPKISADFTVSIQALDDGGNQLAVRRIRIMSISNIRRFGAGNAASNSSLNNTLALRYTSMNQNSSFYQLQGNGKLDLAAERTLSYRFNADYYKELDAINVYDSYLEYRDKGFGLKVGNIYENLDYALSGRGAKAGIRFSNGNTVDVYGVQNNYMLVSQLANSIPGALIAAARYTFNTEEENVGELTYVHGKHKFYELLSDQLSGKTFIKLSEQHRMMLEGGYSMEKQGDLDVKQALASGINYTFNSGKFQFTTNNYYSSPYFTGLRRGIFQSESRLTRTNEKGNVLSARVSLLSNNPKYQMNRRGFAYEASKNVVNIYELGYGFRLGAVSLDVHPYFMAQKLENNSTLIQYPNGVNWNSSSMRTQVNLSFAPGIHSISVNADYGYTFKNTSNLPAAPFHSLRLNSSYNNPLFGVTGYMQLNTYYLSDAFSATDDANFKLYSIGPNTSFAAFRERLTVQVAAMYNYYGFTHSKNYSINSNIRWRIKGNWALAGDIFYSLIKTETESFYPEVIPIANNQSFNTRQIRLGIEKQFAGLSAVQGSKLQLSYYQDENNNGVKDAGELPAVGMTIKVDDEAAITNEKGMVRFQELKPGSYTVYTVNNNGWSMQEPILLIVTKSRAYELPLVKTTVLQGKLIVTGKSYVETNPVLAGIAIYAMDKKGKKYKTLTDAGGSYMFRLPPNAYKVYIETDGMPFSIDNANNQLDLRNSKAVTELNFNYKDERRKVGIKKF